MRSVSLDGHGGSMTSWRIVTPLFVAVFLSRVDLSKQGCADYFDIENWMKYFNTNVSLIEKDDPEETIKCTVERESQKERDISQILQGMLTDCFENKVGDVANINKSCQGEGSKNISFFNFRCLMDKVLDVNAAGCNLEATFELYEKIKADKTTTTTTTTTAPTTLPERTTPTTTAPTAPTTLPERTTPTTLPERTTPTTTTLPPKTPLPSTTTTLSTTSTVTQSAVSGNDATVQMAHNSGAEASNLKALLVVSSSLNVILPLVVYLYMCHQRNKEWARRIAASLEAQSTTDLQILSSPAPLSNEEGAETAYLMEDSKCPSVVTHSAPVMQRENESLH